MNKIALIACIFLTCLLHAEKNTPLCDEIATEATILSQSKEPFCYFIPPRGWQIADQSSLGSQVKMAFVKKSKTDAFCPSMNLVIERVEGNLASYISDVKAIHEQDRKNQWRKLGKVKTCAGEGQLTEIDTSCPAGPVRILQLILLKDMHAYIVTAAALKKDFCNYYSQFQQAFRSLTITEDLFESIPQSERRNALKSLQNNLTKLFNTIPNDQKESLEEFENNQWVAFENKIIQDFEDMGPFWQRLFLIQTRQNLLLRH